MHKYYFSAVPTPTALLGINHNAMYLVTKIIVGYVYKATIYFDKQMMILHMLII